MEKINTESFKDKVLWLLVISTIALILIKFNNQFTLISSSRIIKDVHIGEILESVVMPEKIIVNFGPNSTVILQNKKKYYKQIKDDLRQIFLGSGDLKKLDSDQVDEILNLPNVTIDYADLPSNLLQSSLSINKTAISSIESVCEVIIPFDGNLAMLVDQNNDYYKIDSSVPADLSLFTSIEEDQYIRYYPILEYINSKSSVLVPQNFKFTSTPTKIVSLFNSVSPTEIAKKIFGTKLDFVSYVLDFNGNYFYSYNNGEEILKLQSDGYIKYNNQSLSNKQASSEDAIKTALKFLDKTLIPLDKICLGNTSKFIYNNREGYMINFYYTKDSIPVYIGTDSKVMNIKVIGDRVYSADLYVIEVQQKQASNSNLMYSKDPLKVLTDNLQYIKTVLKIDTKEKSQQFLDKIKDISFIYFADDNDYIIPAWKFTIGDHYFIIDSVSGRMLHDAVV